MQQWSKYQNVIFDFAVNATGNALVQAVAGSGKSTTIVEANARVKAQGVNTVLLAFNKAIADQLKAKGVNAKTFHSLTYSAVTRHVGCRDISTDKVKNLLRQHLSGDEFWLYWSFVARLVGLAKQIGIGIMKPNVEASWLEMMAHYDLEPDKESVDLGRALEIASDALHWSNNSPQVDFDDLLYIAVKDGLTLPKYDLVFVDEVQDTNPIQRAIIRKILTTEGRLIAVGDVAQAIYGFRGADSNSMDMIKKEFSCVELPLTVCYRCPTTVVEYASQWVPVIEARDNAPEGVVKNLGREWVLEQFEADDLILCRATKPLVAMAFRLMRVNKAVYIMGREIGQGLKSLIRKMDAKHLDELEERLIKWRDREIEKAVAKLEDTKAEGVHDKADTILFLMNNLKETERTLEALNRGIDFLFEEGAAKIILATIHKSKGLEANRVYWLNRSTCPAKWVRQEWQQRQELNLCYVAATRAKEELYFIEEK